MTEEHLDEEQVYKGPNYEAGMLQRARCWSDLAPWLKLFSVLRLAASPVYVATAMVGLIGSLLIFSFAGDFSHPPMTQAPPSPTAITHPLATAAASWPQPMATLLGSQPFLPRIGMQNATFSRWLVVILCLLIVWVPQLLILMRAGAVQTASGQLPEPSRCVAIMKHRLLGAYTVFVVPLLILIPLAAAGWLLATIGGWCGVAWISTLTGWAAGALAVILGVIGFGALVAIPISLAAMVCEANIDAFDGCSRGFEYVFRRPIHLILYSALCAAILYLIGFLLGGIQLVASHWVIWSIGSTGSDGKLLAAAMDVIKLVMAAWYVTLSAGLTGGVYLLLRRDTSEQHLEEIWDGPERTNTSDDAGAASDPALPELPPEAYE